MKLEPKEFYSLKDVIEIIELNNKLYDENKNLEKNIVTLRRLLHEAEGKTEIGKNKIKNLQKKLTEISRKLKTSKKIITQSSNTTKANRIIKFQSEIDKLKSELHKERALNFKKGITNQCTGKVRYDSEISAENALSAVQRSTQRKNTPIRKYKCSYCRGYHLTSKAKVAKEDLKTLELADKYINK